MISIALCDNEDKYLNHYESKIKSSAKELNLMVEIIRFNSGESLLFYLEDHPNKFDIIYLDIMMGRINGIETALSIRKFNQDSKIIFLTSSRDFVYHAFDANATNYLIKDLHDTKFDLVFKQTLNSLNKFKSRNVFSIETPKEQIIIPLDEIIYFESFKRLVICHINQKPSIEYYYKISDVTKTLEDKSFVLIHRSFLVNMQFIAKLTSSEVVLKNGVVLPISRNKYDDVKSLFIKYLNGMKL
ncbi:LytR/AlgR family response regulator transcription factor [Acholeplasma granularum]|uniref:LytR/AlgR family response regulator transcription factor n=1 Tax=Acholeplasma granularum TaxID=264635 RepID=UPI0004B248AA|nr:LytTR family DNA-binding domain-containing protein [Acholeplasma granularum]